MIRLLRGRVGFPSLIFAHPLTPLTLEVFRGSTASPGARQGLLLPPLRADFRAAAGARHRRHPRPRGAEVRVPELLLSAVDSRRLLRRPPLRRDCGGGRGCAPPFPSVPPGARPAGPAPRRVD